MKKLYKVCLTRDITESSVVKVEAKNESEARGKAIGMASEVNFEYDENCAGVYVSWAEEVE